MIEVLKRQAAVPTAQAADLERWQRDGSAMRISEGEARRTAVAMVEGLQTFTQDDWDALLTHPDGAWNLNEIVRLLRAVSRVSAEIARAAGPEVAATVFAEMRLSSRLYDEDYNDTPHG